MYKKLLGIATLFSMILLTHPESASAADETKQDQTVEEKVPDPDQELREADEADEEQDQTSEEEAPDPDQALRAAISKNRETSSKHVTVLRKYIRALQRLAVTEEEFLASVIRSEEEDRQKYQAALESNDPQKKSNMTATIIEHTRAKQKCIEEFITREIEIRARIARIKYAATIM